MYLEGPCRRNPCLQRPLHLKINPPLVTPLRSQTQARPVDKFFLISADTTLDVAILHEIITAAEQSKTVGSFPFRAIFAAYDEVLAQHGLDPDHDQVLLRFLFRLGHKRVEGQTLYEAFEALLGQLGIQILFDADDSASQEIDAGSETVDEPGVPNMSAAMRGRSRRASFSSFCEGEDESTRASRQRGNSRASLSHLPKIRPSTRATTRPTERGQSRNARSRTALASPSRGRLREYRSASGNPDDNHTRISLYTRKDDHVQHRMSDETSGGQHEKSEHVYGSPPHDDLDVWHDGTLYQSLVRNVNSSLSIPGYSIPRPTETQLLRDADTWYHYRTRDVAGEYVKRWRVLAVQAYHQHNQMEKQAQLHDRRILLKQAYDQWRILFFSRRQLAETERFFGHLERRATKARDLYLLTKAFTHWAQSAFEEVERSSLARRHILRFRYFNAWLEITAVNELKVRRQRLQKFFGLWKGKQQDIYLENSRALRTYYENLVETIYWRWFWNFCERRAPEWRNSRLKRQFFTRWMQSREAEANCEIQAALSHNKSLKTHYFVIWLNQIRSIAQSKRRAVIFRQAKLVIQCLNEWRKEHKYVPMIQHVSNMVNWRIASSAYSALIGRFQLEQKAKHVNRQRIIRNAWTAWNDRLRWQTLVRQTDDRLTVGALYRWVLAERFRLLLRLHDERLKQRVLRNLADRWQNLTSQLHRSCEVVIARRNTNLLRSLVERWTGQLHRQRQNRRLAHEFYAPRVAQETLRAWSTNTKHHLEMHTWAKDTIFYFRASRTLKHWQTAVIENRKRKRRKAYAAVRLMLKVNIARRIIYHWQSRTTHIMTLHKTAHNGNNERLLQFATSTFDRWHDRFIFALSENSEATQDFNADLAFQHLQIWIEHSRAHQAAITKAVDFATSHVQRAAYESLRALQLKVFEYRSHAQTAAELKGWNDKRHFLVLLRIWREEANRRRGLQALDFGRSFRGRRTVSRLPSTKAVLEVAEVTALQKSDEAVVDDEFEIRDWIPALEAQGSMTPVPGHLSTPSKRAARARALVGGIGARDIRILGSTTPVTPAIPVGLRTPLLRRLHLRPSAESRLGGNQAGSSDAERGKGGFEDIIEQGTWTPETT
ncbi:hypothetical protein MMC19_002866 [Ptychographa xylographoides]|nr:hypothetical protein [Ptychographa xylographoides]